MCRWAAGGRRAEIPVEGHRSGGAVLAEAEGLPLYLPLVGLGQIVYFIQYEPLQPEVHCENQQGAEVREETLPSQQWRDQSLVVDLASFFPQTDKYMRFYQFFPWVCPV